MPRQMSGVLFAVLLMYANMTGVWSNTFDGSTVQFKSRLRHMACTCTQILSWMYQRCDRCHCIINRGICNLQA